MHEPINDGSSESSNRHASPPSDIRNSERRQRPSPKDLRNERIGCLSVFLLLNAIYLIWVTPNILKGGNTIFTHQARAFLCWPLAWPGDLSGWFRNRNLVRWAACAGWGAFIVLILQAALANTRKSFRISAFCLCLLFLASIGGCCNRALNSFNDAF